MKINGKECSVDELVSTIHIDFFKSTKGGLMLNDSEKRILDAYNIDYNTYTRLSDLVFDIESIINDGYGYDMEDLIKLSDDLSERSYYNEVNK